MSRIFQVCAVGVLMALLVIIAPLLQGCSHSPMAHGPELQANAGTYAGVNPVDAKTLHTLFPEAKGKPLFVEFKSKFCLDCKKMTPVLEKLLKDNPKVVSHIYDIKAGEKERPDVFAAFQPSVVPVLVFIKPSGGTHAVKSGLVEEAELKKLILAIQK